MATVNVQYSFIFIVLLMGPISLFYVVLCELAIRVRCRSLHNINAPCRSLVQSKPGMVRRSLPSGSTLEEEERQPHRHRGNPDASTRSKAI